MWHVAPHLSRMSQPTTQTPPLPAAPKADVPPQAEPQPPAKLPPEVGGAPGPEPTRYGDWQHKGRVTDF